MHWQCFWLSALFIGGIASILSLLCKAAEAADQYTTSDYTKELRQKRHQCVCVGLRLPVSARIDWANIDRTNSDRTWDTGRDEFR